MSNLSYLKLWQQKRDELPVTTDVQADWLDMQSVLDKHMPLNNAGQSGGNSGSGASVGSKLVQLIKAKLLYSVVALIVAASVTYFAVKQMGWQYNKPKKTELRKDSLLNNTVDSIQLDSASIDTFGLLNNGAGVDSAINTGNEQSVATANNKDNIDANNSDVSKPGGRGTAETGVNPVEENASANGIVKNSAANKIATNNKLLSNNTVLNGSLLGNNANAKNHRVNTNNKLSSGNNKTGNVNKRNRSNSQIKPFTSNGRDTRYANADQSLNNGLSAIDKGRSNRSSQQKGASNTNSNLFFAKRDEVKTALIPSMPPMSFDWQNTTSAQNNNNGINLFADYKIANHQPKALKKSETDKKAKLANSGKGLGFSLNNFDAGALAGIGSSGEMHAGLFTTYNFNNKWAIGTQLRLFTPYAIKGNYTSPNKSIKDTNQVLLITDSRKLQTADMPLFLLYNITKNISVKGGAILNIPLKQSNALSTFTTSGARKDSTGYYRAVDSTLAYTSYSPKPSLSLTGGLNLNFNRWLIDVAYYQNLQTQQVSSPLGNYTFKRRGVQFSIGFKLNKPKPE